MFQDALVPDTKWPARAGGRIREGDLPGHGNMAGG